MATLAQNPVARATGSLSVLNAVTILQPVSSPELESHFPGAKRIVQGLKSSGMVRRLRNGKWIVTPRGLGFASTKEMGRKRDILRMFELIERTRRR